MDKNAFHGISQSLMRTALRDSSYQYSSLGRCCRSEAHAFSNLYLLYAATCSAVIEQLLQHLLVDTFLRYYPCSQLYIQLS